jgi:hypothetical protein
MVGCDHEKKKGFVILHLPGKMGAFLIFKAGPTMQGNVAQRTILCELMHAFFLPHNPPLEGDGSIHKGAIREFYSE